MSAYTGFTTQGTVETFGLGMPALLVLEDACKRSQLYFAEEDTGVFSRRLWALAKHEASRLDLETLSTYLNPDISRERLLLDLIQDLLADGWRCAHVPDGAQTERCCPPDPDPDSVVYNLTAEGVL